MHVVRLVGAHGVEFLGGELLDDTAADHHPWLTETEGDATGSLAEALASKKAESPSELQDLIQTTAITRSWPPKDRASARTNARRRSAPAASLRVRAGTVLDVARPHA